MSASSSPSSSEFDGRPDSLSSFGVVDEENGFGQMETEGDDDNALCEDGNGNGSYKNENINNNNANETTYDNNNNNAATATEAQPHGDAISTLPLRTDSSPSPKKLRHASLVRPVKKTPERTAPREKADGDSGWRGDDGVHRGENCQVASSAGHRAPSDQVGPGSVDRSTPLISNGESSVGVVSASGANRGAPSTRKKLRATTVIPPKRTRQKNDAGSVGDDAVAGTKAIRSSFDESRAGVSEIIKRALEAREDGILDKKQLSGLIGSGVLVNTKHLLGGGKYAGSGNEEDDFGKEEDDVHEEEVHKKQEDKMKKPHIGVITRSDGTQEFIEVIPIAESKRDIRHSLEELDAQLSGGGGELTEETLRKGFGTQLSSGDGELTEETERKGFGVQVSGGGSELMEETEKKGFNTQLSGGGGELIKETERKSFNAQLSGGGGELTEEMGKKGFNAQLSGGAGELKEETDRKGFGTQVSGGGGELTMEIEKKGIRTQASSGGGELMVETEKKGIGVQPSAGGGKLMGERVRRSFGVQRSGIFVATPPPREMATHILASTTAKIPNVDPRRRQLRLRDPPSVECITDDGNSDDSLSDIGAAAAAAAVLATKDGSFRSDAGGEQRQQLLPKEKRHEGHCKRMAPAPPTDTGLTPVMGVKAKEIFASKLESLNSSLENDIKLEKDSARAALTSTPVKGASIPRLVLKGFEDDVDESSEVDDPSVASLDDASKSVMISMATAKTTTPATVTTTPKETMTMTEASATMAREGASGAAAGATRGGGGDGDGGGVVGVDSNERTDLRRDEGSKRTAKKSFPAPRPPVTSATNESKGEKEENREEDEFRAAEPSIPGVEDDKERRGRREVEERRGRREVEERQGRREVEGCGGKAEKDKRRKKSPAKKKKLADRSAEMNVEKEEGDVEDRDADDVNLNLEDVSKMEEKPLLLHAVESTSVFLGDDSSLDGGEIKNRTKKRTKNRNRVKRRPKEEAEEGKRRGCPGGVVAGIGVSVLIVVVGTALMLHYLL